MSRTRSPGWAPLRATMRANTRRRRPRNAILLKISYMRTRSMVSPSGCEWPCMIRWSIALLLYAASRAASISKTSSLPGPGEQVADGGGQDACRVVFADPAGPDLLRASMDERDAGRHQPGGRKIGAERAVGPAAFQQCADCLVGGLVGAGHRFGAQLLGDGLGHGAVAGQVLPGGGEHPFQRLDRRAGGGVGGC